MTRVSHASFHRGAHAPTSLKRPRAASVRKKKPYKIVLEAVTQEKRKLQSIFTYHDEAPIGFGYIPVGYPEITEWCKEQCRQRNLDVHIVSAKPSNKIHADPGKISHHVHRIGHHFPLEIIDLACSKFGYRFTDQHGLQKRRSGRTTYGEKYFERGIADYQQRQRLHGRSVADTETKESIRGAVREMFPKIPEADLTSIVNHAFQKGTNRVGNAKELSLARRVQLAVVAHIRHTYTEYDRMLKTGSWLAARQRVEHVSLAKLKEWRDEAGRAENEFEETFREVIVLDDEEESSDDEDLTNIDKHEPSMEIVSNRATARDLQPEPADRSYGYVSSVSRAHGRTTYLPMHALCRSPYVAYPPIAHPAPQMSPVDCRASLPGSHSESVTFRHEPFRATHSRTMDPRAREPLVREALPMRMRDSNGQLYNLQPIEEHRGDERRRRIEDPSRLAYEQSSTTSRHLREEIPQPPVRRSSHASRPILAPSSKTAPCKDIVLPSVECEPEHAGPSDALSTARSQNVLVSPAGLQTSKRKSFPPSAYNLEERAHETAAKWSRPVYDGYKHPAPVESYRRFGAPPQNNTIDLTSSPTRLLCGRQREPYGPVHPHGTAQHAFAPRGLPMCEVRGAYLGAPVRESLRAYVSEDKRAYAGQTLPHFSHTALTEEAMRFHPNGSRFLRSGAEYGRSLMH